MDISFYIGSWNSSIAFFPGRFHFFDQILTNEGPVTIKGQQLEDVNEFMYLGSFVNNLGGADKDIPTSRGKERAG